jgi:hypothetical protein
MIYLSIIKQPAQASVLSAQILVLASPASEHRMWPTHEMPLIYVPAHHKTSLTHILHIQTARPASQLHV